MSAAGGPRDAAGTSTPEAPMTPRVRSVLPRLAALASRRP